MKTRTKRLLGLSQCFVVFELASKSSWLILLALISGWHLLLRGLGVEWPLNALFDAFEFYDVDLLQPDLGNGVFLLVVGPRLAQLSLGLWGVWQARLLLRCYQRGSIFTDASVHRLSRIGSAAVAFGLVPIASIDQAAGEYGLQFPANWSAIYLGLFIYVMAVAHREGLRLQREQDLVI